MKLPVEIDLMPMRRTVDRIRREEAIVRDCAKYYKTWCKRGEKPGTGMEFDEYLRSRYGLTHD